MKRPPDPLARMSDAARKQAMERLWKSLLGPVNGALVWDQMSAVMDLTERQIGDHPEPEKNYWQGVWRIYDLE